MLHSVTGDHQYSLMFSDFVSNYAAEDGSKWAETFDRYAYVKCKTHWVHSEATTVHWAKKGLIYY